MLELYQPGAKMKCLAGRNATQAGGISNTFWFQNKFLIATYSEYIPSD